MARINGRGLAIGAAAAVTAAALGGWAVLGGAMYPSARLS